MIYINKKYVAFIVGLFSVTQVRFLGTFAISEFMIFVTIVYLLLKNPRPFRAMFQNKRMIVLLVLCFLWMCSTFFSDQINENDLTNSLKGFFGIVPLFFGFIFFYWLLYDNLSVIYFYILGSAISFVISLFVFVPSALEYTLAASGADSLLEITELGPRLFAAAIGGFVSIISFKFYPKHPYIVCMVRLLNSLYALLKGSRGSFFLGLLITFILAYFARYSNKRFLNNNLITSIQKQLPIIIVVIIVGGIIAKNIYSYSAEQGYLGDSQKRKYEKQASSKMGLLSGRGEFVSAYLAIKDAPWFGHGSYPLDENGYAVEASELTGDELLSDTYREEYIPTHSHLTGSWVQNGILGALFWIYGLYLIFQFLSKYVYICPVYMGYTISASVGAFWNILFSPFSNRPALGVFFAFIIVMMNHIDRQKKADCNFPESKNSRISETNKQL